MDEWIMYSLEIQDTYIYLYPQCDENIREVYRKNWNN